MFAEGALFAVGALFVVGAAKEGPQVASKVPMQQSSAQAGFVSPGEREGCRELMGQLCLA